MNKKDFKIRLENLYCDVNMSDTRALEMLSFINDANCDKEELLNKIYFSNNSPLKVIDLTFNPGGTADYTGEMINVSMKYDMFVEQMNNAARDIINRHSDAIRLFSEVLSLPSPYSQILYFRYYKGISNEKIMETLLMSKTTYYRYIDHAISLVMKNYFGRGVT